MKRILFFHPDLRGGGAEKVLVDLLKKLDTNRFEITLFTIFEEGINRKNLPLTVRQQWHFKKVFRGYSVLQRIFPPSWLYRFFIREKYDVVVAYLEGVPTRIVSGCRDQKTKKIAWIHTKIDDIGIDSVYNGRKAMRNCYLLFDQVVCVSKVSRENVISYLDLPEDRVKVIYNALDVQGVLTKASQKFNTSFSPGVVNLVSVGRLNPQKGFDRLMEVCRKLKEDGLSFVLRIAGAGEEQKNLEALIEKFQLNEQVILLGFQSNPYPLVKNSDLFVCSSRLEGFSTAVSEAIILDVPVVTTDCSGMDEILDHGKFGVIVKNDTQSLYEGLKPLLEDRLELARWKLKAEERRRYFLEADHVKEVEKLLEQ